MLINPKYMTRAELEAEVTLWRDRASRRRPYDKQVRAVRESTLEQRVAMAFLERLPVDVHATEHRHVLDREVLAFSAMARWAGKRAGS